MGYNYSDKFRAFVLAHEKEHDSCSLLSGKYLLVEDLKNAILNFAETKDLALLFSSGTYEVQENFDLLLSEFFKKEDYLEYSQIPITRLYGKRLDAFNDIYIGKKDNLIQYIYNFKLIAENTQNLKHYKYCIDAIKSYNEYDYKCNSCNDIIIKRLMSCLSVRHIECHRMIFKVGFEK